MRRREGRTLCQLQEQLPSLCMAKEELLCRRRRPGRCCGGMTEWVRKGNHRAELLDGIRLQAEDGWVLFCPTPTRPRFQIVAQADSMDNARRLPAVCQSAGEDTASHKEVIRCRDRLS